MKGEDALRRRLKFCVHATEKAREPEAISSIGPNGMEMGRARGVGRDAG